jgi:Nucleoside-diphosphate-sugar epimerases
MAPYLFTKALFEGQTIKLFNHGKQRRDFTYIDDIVQGVVGAIDRAKTAGRVSQGEHRLYNLGNNQSETLEDFVAALENSTHCKANIELVPAQPGDVVETYADINRAASELGFSPKINMAQGLEQFVGWYRDYHGIS